MTQRDRFDEFAKVIAGESLRDKSKRLTAERIVAEMKEAAGSLKQHLEEQYEGNAELQRMKMETQEEKTRRAMTQLTKARKEYNDFKYATDTTWTQAETEVKELVRAFHRDRGWE